MSWLQKYRELIIAIVLILALAIIFHLVVTFSVMSRQKDAVYQPTSGMWFCQELSLYLSFDTWDGYFIDDNGEKTICTIRIAGKYSSTINICEVQESFSTEAGIQHIAGKQLLSLEYLSLSKSSYEVKSNDGKTYTFVVRP